MMACMSSGRLLVIPWWLGVRRSGTLCPRCTLSSPATRQKLWPAWFPGFCSEHQCSPSSGGIANQSEREREGEGGRRRYGNNRNNRNTQKHPRIANSVNRSHQPPADQAWLLWALATWRPWPVRMPRGASCHGLGHPRQVLSLSEVLVVIGYRWL